MKLPPHAPLRSTAAIGAPAKADSHLPLPSMHPGATVSPHLHSEALFRAPRSGRIGGGPRTTPPASGPHRRRAPRARSTLADGVPSDLDELDQHVDDEESRRAIAAASRSAGAHGEDGSGQGGEREGNHQERRFAAVARSRALPSAPEALSLQALVERARAARSFDELVVPLRATIRQSQSGLSEAFVRVAAAWRASPAAIAGPVPVTLAGVKRALLDPMADTSVAPGDGGIDRRAAAHLWLPIYLLNLHRPRSPTQSLQAAERLALIERVLRGRLAGPNRP